MRHRVLLATTLAVSLLLSGCCGWWGPHGGHHGGPGGPGPGFEQGHGRP